MSKNIQRLGETLVKRMEKTAAAAVKVATEYGTINYNMSLTPDSLNVPIPEGDYLIVKGANPQPGDRVLISWCGNDPVVTGAAGTEADPISVTVTSDGVGNVTISW